MNNEPQQPPLNLSAQTPPIGRLTSILAIDPGAAGGLAIYRHDGTTDAVKMPATPKDICDWITIQQYEAAQHATDFKCYLEEVGGYMGSPGESNQAPATAMFNFGRGFGNIEGFLIALGIPFEMVRPQKWQRALSLGNSGRVKGEYTPHMSAQQRIDEKRRVSSINGRIKTAWKNKLKEHAQRLHPQLHVTLATCDALLIAEYGKHQTI